MRRRLSRKRPDAVPVVCHYEMDTARVAKALLVVLRWREAHPPANESTVEESTAEGRETDAQGQQTPTVAP